MYASTATIATYMRTTFPSIRFGLVMYIVVSRPIGVLGGVVHCDYGKTVAGGVFHQTGMMHQPPQVLLKAITADEILGNNKGIVGVISDILDTNVEMKSPFSRPANEQDWLFDPAYDHPQGEDTCIKYDRRQLMHRDPHNSDEPQIHY